MHANLFLFALAALPVPNVSAGPDLADQANAIDAPIAEVTVYSDRATVVRKASVPLSSSYTTVRLPDLPGNTMPDSVRVSATGADVWRIEVAYVDRERVSIAQADEWLEQLDQLSDEIARLDAKTGAMDFRLQLLTGIAPAAPVPEAQRDGRARSPLAPDAWNRALDFLSTERSAAREARRKLGYERIEVQEKLAAIQAEVGRLNQGGFSNRRQQVIVILGKTNAQRASVEVEYTVPGASWRPAYDLTYLAAKNEVVLDTSARVTQASGEDWEDAALRLSTAMPGADIRVPKLLTWTLGEAKELVPVPRPRTAMPSPLVYAPPSPVTSDRDRMRTERLEQLRQRLVQVGGKIGTKTTSYDFGSEDVSGALAQPNAGYLRAEKKMPSRPQARPPSPAPSVQSDRQMESLAYGESSSAPPSIKMSASISRDSASQTRGLSLFESPPPPRVQLGDRTLPAMLAGGFDYVYEGQTKATVPSDGREVRVPLASDRHPVEAYYEATPSLAKTAYLEAKVTNKSDRPILGGPVTIFVGDQFSGDGQLGTTGAGGEIELPLGADEDVKVERRIIPSTETTGFISKDDVTTYRVVLEVANYKRRKIRVGVMEPLPKTTNEDIEVKLVSAKPAQTEGPDEQGLLRWNLDLAPGAKTTVELVYSIERPENWKLYQR